MNLDAVGFCGVDDSVHPNQVVLYATSYPLVEFGVLFRPDKEGQPRYPSKKWVELLSKAVAASNSFNVGFAPPLKLAAHLCERRVDEVLRGDDSFVKKLYKWGFKRVQINATAVNGVDTSVFEPNPFVAVRNLLSIANRHPELEFILQKNEETMPLWNGVLEIVIISNKEFPSNVSFLLDESKGTGVLPEEWAPMPLDMGYKVGYAGGIGPSNLSDVLSKIEEANTESGGRSFWIDMESSLRSQKNGKDVFDLDKCYQVILEVCQKGFVKHPPFLFGGKGSL